MPHWDCESLCVARLQEEPSAIAVNESDLVALLNQFSTEILYANTLQHFLSDNRKSMISLICKSIAMNGRDRECDHADSQLVRVSIDTHEDPQ